MTSCFKRKLFTYAKYSHYRHILDRTRALQLVVNRSSSTAHQQGNLSYQNIISVQNYICFVFDGAQLGKVTFILSGTLFEVFALLMIFCTSHLQP